MPTVTPTYDANGNLTNDGLHAYSWDADGNSATVDSMVSIPFRKYNPYQGRWISPDPGGLSVVDPSNPQSWNRYAYVLNNPLAFKDPLGLYCVYLNDKGDAVEEIDDDGDKSGCDGSGGYWIEGSYGGGSWVIIDVNSGLVAGLGYNAEGYPEVSLSGAFGSNPFGSFTQTWNSGVLGANTTPFDAFRQTINGFPANNGTQPRIMDATIHAENSAFNQCVKEGTVAAVGVAATTTLWDKGKHAEVHVAEASLDLQADCLSQHPLAAADPSYQGQFSPGDCPVSPDVQILGWSFCY
jgi:RHS repeat-associated protein